MGIVFTFQNGSLNRGIDLLHKPKNRNTEDDDVGYKKSNEKANIASHPPYIKLSDKKVVPLSTHRSVIFKNKLVYLSNEPYHLLKVGKQASEMSKWIAIEKTSQKNINRILEHKTKHEEEITSVIDSIFDDVVDIENLGDSLVKAIENKGHKKIENESILSKHISCSCLNDLDIVPSTCPEIASGVTTTINEEGVSFSSTQSLIGIKPGTAVDFIFGSLSERIKIYRIVSTKKSVNLYSLDNARMNFVSGIKDGAYD